MAASTCILLGLTSGCDPRTESGGSSPGSYEQQLKTEAQARSADPAWKPATEEVAVIQVGDKGKGGRLHNFCLDTNGNILACWGTSETAAKNALAQIKVFSPDGKFLYTANDADQDMTVLRLEGNKLVPVGSLKLPGHPASMRGSTP